MGVVSTSKRWKTVLLAGIGIYVAGALVGVGVERFSPPGSNIPILLFPAWIGTGAVVSLSAYIGLGIKANAGFVIASGYISLFLAWSMPRLFEYFGYSLCVHRSSGIALMIFRVTTGLGGILLIVIGLVRMSHSE